jgi:hypothetical protein
MEMNRQILDLDSQDITLIEHAIRDEIDVLAYENFTLSAENVPANRRKIRALEELLGRLHSQRPERQNAGLCVRLG